MNVRAPLIILSLLICLTACTPQIQEIGEPVRAAAITQESFKAADGADIPLKAWLPDEDISAVIIAIHGFNDYRNGFAFPASWWMQNGIATYAYDQRGFGENANRGIWPGQDQLVADLQVIVQLVKGKHPDKPLYLLGESMGGAIVISTAVSTELSAIDGVILSAPAVWGWSSLNLFYRAVLWTSAHTLPSMTASGSGLGIQASDNISMLRNLGHDKNFIKETRIDAVYGLVGLMDYAYHNAKRIKVPTLVLYGAKDEVIPKKPVERVVQTLPATSDIVLYEEGWHLLMRDLQAKVVWQDVASWIKDREIPSGNKVTEFPLFAKKP